MAGVVAEADRLDEILVQREGPRDDAGDAGRLERVRHPRAVVVADRIDEDLRLALQAAERLRVDDAVAIALERRAHLGLGLGSEAALVAYDRTASGESRSSSSAAHPLGEALLRQTRWLQSWSQGIRRPAPLTGPQRVGTAQMMIGTVPPSTLQAAPVT